MNPKSMLRKYWSAAALFAASVITSHGTDGTWVSLPSSNWSGNWSETQRWTDGVIADGVGAIADLSTVNVTSAGMTVTLDSNRKVGKLFIGDSGGTAGAVTIAQSGGSTLTFDNGGSVALLRMGGQTGGGGSTQGSPISTVAANVLLNDSLNIENNFALGNASLRVSGSISAGSAGTKIISHLTNTGARPNAGVLLSGVISDGAGKVAIVQNSSTGDLTLTKNNSYSGGTTISKGTLILSGTGTLGTGSVEIGKDGALDITGITGSLYSLSGSQSLRGEGVIHATGKGLMLAGTLASQGLEIEGDFTLTSTAIATFAIRGTGSGDYDHLAVQGLLSLGGTLVLETAYNAQLGDTVKLFDGTVISGLFTQVLGSDLGGGLYWDTSKLGLDGSITVIPEAGAASMLLVTGIAGAAAFHCFRRRRADACN